MLWQIIKKQALILLRNPVQILLLLGLPIILITILGTALSNWMDGESIEINVKVAMIEQEDEEKQVNQFISDIESGVIPETAIEMIKETAPQIAPIGILKDSVFKSEELANMIDLHEAKPSEKEELLDDSSFAAVIEVPENFTYDTLQTIMLHEDISPELRVYHNEQQEIGANIVSDILTQFQEQMTFGVFLSEKGIDLDAIQIDTNELPGEVKRINQGNPISSKDYYTIGMAVMNVLFMATAIGWISFHEKATHVFDRVIIANVSKWIYFLGILLSGMIFAFIQLLVLFSFAWIVFDVTWPDLTSFLIVSLFISISVGGLTVLLAAISYRLNSENIIDFFGSVVVSLMAFIGGSFFPIGDSSKLLQTLGDLTPNGAGMSAYLTILRGEGISEVSHHLLYILGFAISSIIIGALSFPKRGASA
ncbi:ABC transporter permease [Oceanobacillus halophilus]|uniref:ABC transporter permease n=1 Tax=Oceanobacillus halophilus TaxID=930130 RepID=A0A495A465_9BACI|nr:ABC transporter permease [Oceanobacillus halophilus]RKQ33860.1 ABC transporter permease [Oceanobacillus halophilus]